MDYQGPSPPEHFSEEGKSLWESVYNEFEITAEAVPVLKTAIESYDRMNKARKIIEEEGITITDPSGRIRAHPAISAEKESRSGFLQSWRLLGLGAEEPGQPGRPGRFK